MKNNCPTCGETPEPHSIKHLYASSSEISFGPRKILVQRRQSQLFQMMARTYPRPCHRDRMTVVLEDNESISDDSNLISVLICKMRSKVGTLGMKITTHYGFGYALEIIEPLTVGEIAESVVSPPAREVIEMENELKSMLDMTQREAEERLEETRRKLKAVDGELEELKRSIAAKVDEYKILRTEVSNSIARFECTAQKFRTNIGEHINRVNDEVKVSGRLVSSMP